MPASLVVAIGMTATMVAWMRDRGMEWRPVLEMATAMTLPLVPIFALLTYGVIPGAAACGAYCAAMIPAMVIVMQFRLDLFAGRTAHHGHTGSAPQAA